jgi:UDP:flavonoid glycosyltransferase YjiC (YdhE family)
MRVLVTSSPPIGHVHPLVPLAAALRRAGHDLRWATGPDACPIVAAAGIEPVVAGLSAADRRNEYFRRYPEARQLSPEDLPGHMFPRLFGTVSAPPMLDDLLAFAERWHPDVVVHEASELSAPILAALLGVPTVNQGYGALVHPDRMGAASDAVAPLWEKVGLPPRPWAGSYDHLYLDIYPPSLRLPYGDYVARRQSMRPIPYSATLDDAAAIGWSGDDDDRPLIYLTFGTVFNATDGAFRHALDGLAGLDARVLVTVGPGGDPDAFGPQPEHITVTRYVPQTAVLPRCSLVASHAGSGTFLAALDHGLAQLCMPQAADQFGNARQCEAAGAGMCLLPGDVTSDAVRDAARGLLANPAFSARARYLRDEIRAMPHPDDLVPLIEELAARSNA